ncbi:DUF268 domain-containing protein [Pelagicoccus enzymogenes]|uniref:DUF268 domain-containing protein n=1 Tax=Pelagicoccus enzymogenes TaxID=2773457 RepID=UPI00280FD50F|nr:DUF268 domain-containing protein [Pelagicoccus enzymogenes]MDQ8199774.1 DUF268 domain-containing protein [Pelagicoccus enzymogenes]
MLKSLYYILTAAGNPLSFIKNVTQYPYFFSTYLKYKKTHRKQSETIRFRPILTDRTSTTSFDAHYLYLGYWAFLKIAENKPDKHVDIGAQLNWVAWLSTIIPVTFIDIRPFSGSLPTVESRKGSVLSMPFEDQSVLSLSCLHVAEHIGLGRYGDPLDGDGTYKTITELSRTLAPGGKLYFATPVGVEMVCFNAHRISNPERILRAFESNGLKLVEFSAVGDDGELHRNTLPERFSGSRYACGMYELTR